MVLGTSLVLRSGSDAREILLDDFYIDYQVNDLQPGEFIESIRIPLPDDDVVLRSHKLSKRFDQDISAVCAAFRLKLEDDRVTSFRMACGGMAPTIRRASSCEAEIEGQRWNDETLSHAIDALKKDFTPISDMRASAEYRLQATQNLLRRFYLESRGEFTETVYTYGRRD